MLSEIGGRPTRSPTAVTIAVWRALFLREALTRVSAGRIAWFWLLVEPVFHVTYLMVLYSVIRVQAIGGIDIALWIMVGLLAFFMFRRTGTQSMNAVGASGAMFAYRQVKPVDTVLVRAALEGVLTCLVGTVLLFGGALFGVDVLPSNPLEVLIAFSAMWLVGLGLGLIVSVIVELVPEVGQVIRLAMMPLYLISGVIFPLSQVPQPYISWLLLNPVAHGVEAVRLGFASHYHAVPGLSLSYAFGFALVSIFLGLALHQRYGLRMVAK